MCNYCRKHEFGNVWNDPIVSQTFNDKALHQVSLNPFNPRLLSTGIHNLPDRGGSTYGCNSQINYCPMCGRDLEEEMKCQNITSDNTNLSKD